MNFTPKQLLEEGGSYFISTEARTLLSYFTNITYHRKTEDNYVYIICFLGKRKCKYNFIK